MISTFEKILQIYNYLARFIRDKDIHHYCNQHGSYNFNELMAAFWNQGNFDEDAIFDDLNQISSSASLQFVEGIQLDANLGPKENKEIIVELIIECKEHHELKYNEFKNIVNKVIKFSSLSPCLFVLFDSHNFVRTLNRK